MVCPGIFLCTHKTPCHRNDAEKRCRQVAAAFWQRGVWRPPQSSGNSILLFPQERVNVCGGQCCHGWSKAPGFQRCTKQEELELLICPIQQAAQQTFSQKVQVPQKVSPVAQMMFTLKQKPPVGLPQQLQSHKNHKSWHQWIPSVALTLMGVIQCQSIGASDWAGRNPRSPLRDVFCGLSNFCPTIGSASALGACPHANASDSGTIVDSGTVLGPDLASVLAFISHASTVVDVDYDAGTDGPGADVCIRTSAFVGDCKWIDTSSIDSSSCRTDGCANTWSGVCSAGTVWHTTSTNTAPRVSGPSGGKWQGASTHYKLFLLFVTGQSIAGYSCSPCA
ncbi:Latent-transforming growth factor beta-binding protein 1 [Chelonia mydas]|uniref:Latent-transforming growth factor beta-binding protein 1 n=1 Tax=Chelonia mydas TaxID=8469 RepID=M7AHK3_CHEMY|nr:Latent-transforming growth factor beta-binding protein 1 [Chelonia mydas]